MGVDEALYKDFRVRLIRNSKGHLWPPRGENIQVAIDDLDAGDQSAHSGAVWLPWIPVNAPMEIPATIKLHGELLLKGLGYKGTALKLANGVNAPMFLWDENHQERALHMEGMYLLGNKGNQAAGAALFHIDDVNGGELEDVIMRDMVLMNGYGVGLLSDSSWGWILDKVIVEGSTSHGMQFIGGTHPKISNCKINNNAGNGFYGSTKRLLFQQNEVCQNELHGIEVSGEDWDILGNTVKGNSQAVVGASDDIHVNSAGDRTKILGGMINGDWGGTDQARHGVFLANGALDCIIDDIDFGEHVTNDVYITAGALRTLLGDGNRYRSATPAAILEPTTRTPWLWMPIHDVSHAQVGMNAIGDYFSVRMASNQDCDFHFNVEIPMKFHQLYRARVLVICEAANPTLRYSIDTDFCACDEVYTTHSDSIAMHDENLTQNVKECLDINAAFDGIAPGDTVGVLFTRNGAAAADDAGNVHVLGFRMEYI